MVIIVKTSYCNKQKTNTKMYSHIMDTNFLDHPLLNFKFSFNCVE
jgi:hypothetical protein